MKIIISRASVVRKASEFNGNRPNFEETTGKYRNASNQSHKWKWRNISVSLVAALKTPLNVLLYSRNGQQNPHRTFGKSRSLLASPISSESVRIETQIILEISVILIERSFEREPERERETERNESIKSNHIYGHNGHCARRCSGDAQPWKPSETVPSAGQSEGGRLSQRRNGAHRGTRKRY